MGIYFFYSSWQKYDRDDLKNSMDLSDMNVEVNQPSTKSSLKFSCQQFTTWSLLISDNQGGP